MKRTTRFVTEMKCENCGIIHLLGETFNGQRCCDHPKGVPIGEREVVEYISTIQDDMNEVLWQMQQFEEEHRY